MIHSITSAPFPIKYENFPQSGDDSGRDLCRIAVSRILVLLFCGGATVSRKSSGSGGSGRRIAVASMIVVGVGCGDGDLAGGFELFEGLLEEGGGVFGCAATFHAGGDVGPEAGGEGVFDFLFGLEEMLMLLGGMVG